MEEVNALGIYSAAKFGYGGAVPYLVAQNADYNSVFFESFENVFGSGSTATFEDKTPGGTSRTGDAAHSGEYSFRLSSFFETRPFRKAI